MKFHRHGKGTYELAHAHVLENLLEDGVGLDVVVGQSSMDKAVRGKKEIQEDVRAE